MISVNSNLLGLFLTSGIYRQNSAEASVSSANLQTTTQSTQDNTLLTVQTTQVTSQNTLVTKPNTSTGSQSVSGINNSSSTVSATTTNTTTTSTPGLTSTVLQDANSTVSVSPTTNTISIHQTDNLTTTSISPSSTSQQNTIAPNETSSTSASNTNVFNNTTSQSPNTTGTLVVTTTTSSVVTENTPISSVATNVTTIPPNTTDEANLTSTPSNFTDATTITTTPNSNTTETGNGTTIQPSINATTSLTDSTTDSFTNTSVDTNATATDTTPTSSNVTENNITGTPNNSTSTEASNVTVTDNSTIAATVTPTPTVSSTQWKPWEPSDQGTFAPNSNNLAVIVIPILAILILSFIAVLVFVLCKRARKASRRTRVPEEKKTSDTSATNYGTSSPFITAPYHSSQEPTAVGHDNVAFQGDNTKKEQTSKFQNVTFNEAEKTKCNQSDKAHASQLLKAENGKNPQNGIQSKARYEEVNFKDDNIELANIVIESDPEDVNRYFKKADLGDWYRVVMKRRPPKDTEKLLGENETKEKTGKHERHKHERAGHKDRKHRHRSSMDHDGSLSDTNERTKRISRDKYDPTKHGSESSAHSRHRSSERELSSSLPKPKTSNRKEIDKLAASLPLNSATQNPDDRKGASYISAKIQTPQTKVIMSRPIAPDASVSANKAGHAVSEVASKPVTKEPAPHPQPRIILSQPKTSSIDNTVKTVGTVNQASVSSQKRPESVPRLNLSESGRK